MSSSAIATITFGALNVYLIHAAAPLVLIHSPAPRSTVLPPMFPPETDDVVIVAPAAASSSSPKPSPNRSTCPPRYCSTGSIRISHGNTSPSRSASYA